MKTTIDDMLFSRTRCIYFIFAALFFYLPFGCFSFVLQQPLDQLRPARRTIKISEKRIFRSGPFGKRNRSDKPKITLFGDTSIEATACRIHDIDSSIILSTADSSFGGLVGILGLGLSAAVGAFIFANIVYTPEIVQGAQLLRQSNREIEIRKLLEAVHSHQADGNALIELRLPLETALGTTLEEYIIAVESGLEDIDITFTTADQDLVNILKQSI